MTKFEERLSSHSNDFRMVVPFEQGDRWLKMDFREDKGLTAGILGSTDQFIHFINEKLEKSSARYGIGGYLEYREIYSRSELFENHKEIPKGTSGNFIAEPRRLHLGIDIWGKPYTRVMAPLDGIVHSFGFHNDFGDYGTTIILSHQLDGESFFTLYGHLSLNSIQNMQEGDLIRAGDVFAGFGIPMENGHWPPHLHFQIIKDLEGWKGDYPGVCKVSEKEKYAANCPDPDIILGLGVG